MDTIRSPFTKPESTLGDPSMNDSTTNGTARSNIPGVFSTSPIIEWSMYMSSVSVPRSTVALRTLRRARSACSMLKFSGT